MDNQFALGWMGKYDDAATEDERSKKFLARHDEQVGAEPGSLQVRTPERVAAEIAQLKADRQARVRRPHVRRLLLRAAVPLHLRARVGF